MTVEPEEELVACSVETSLSLILLGDEGWVDSVAVAIGALIADEAVACSLSDLLPTSVPLVARGSVPALEWLELLS